MIISLSPFVPENLLSRDRFDRPVPRRSCYYTCISILLLMTSPIIIFYSAVCTSLLQLLLYGHASYRKKSKDRSGKVANPARGQLNRENTFSLSAVAPENLASRDGFGSPVPRQPAHLRNQAESDAYLHYAISPEFRGGVYLFNSVHCQQSAGTGPVSLKVVPNECYLGRSPYVCVCVFFPFILDIMDVPAGVTQEEGHTGFFIHVPSAVRALIFLARRIQPLLSLVDREVEFGVLTI